MDMAHGNQPNLIQIFMWDRTRMIKKVDTEDTSGPMDVFTKVTSLKMLSNHFFLF